MKTTVIFIFSIVLILAGCVPTKTYTALQDKFASAESEAKKAGAELDILNKDRADLKKS